MARRPSRRAYGARSTYRRAATARRSTGRSYGRRATGRRTGARSGGTVKLVIQMAGAPVPSEGLPIGFKAAPKPKRAKL